MHFSVLTRAAEILVDKVKQTGIDLNDCKILKWPYCKFNTCGYGFLIIFVEHNCVRVAGISQDVISANCIDKFDEAIRFITNKANQLWNSTI